MAEGRQQPWPAIAHQRKRKFQRAVYHAARETFHRYQVPRPSIPLSDKSPNPTVYFLTPDLDIPAGGVRVMYSHVDLLNSAGVEAAVLHQRKGFRCSWFENTTRVTDIRSSAIGPDDVVVVPEGDVDVLTTLHRCVRHVVLNQSGHLTWMRRGEAVTRHYANAPGLLGVIVVSEYIARMLRYAYPKLAIHRVRNGIDHTLFYPTGEPKVRRISYHPRRGRRELDIVIHMLQAKGVLRDWEFSSLAGLNQADFAAAVRSSRITVNLSCWEGFGLTTCEAMACGNYVVGFHGFGGLEFMRPEFSCPVETGDVVAVAEAMERVIALDSVDDQWCQSRGRLASAFVLDEYSRHKEYETVISAYRALLSSS